MAQVGTWDPVIVVSVTNQEWKNPFEDALLWNLASFNPVFANQPSPSDRMTICCSAFR